MPKVSILIPIYNVEKYLAECLESIVKQTLTDIEIICINDGSTDSSLEIIEEYAQQDSRIKIIDKPNSGYGASMNLGISAATGEYIGIVEPDDFVKHEMYSKLYEIAKKNDADVVKSDFYEFHTASKTSRKSGKISRFIANRVINAKEEPKILKIMPSIWSGIYKKSFLVKNNICFLETAGASYQDTSFAFKVMTLAKKVVLTSKAYVYYRLDNENSSVKSSDKVYAICDEYAEITKLLDKNPTIKEFASDIKLIKEYSAYVWNAKRIDCEKLEEFVEEFSKIFRKYYENNELKKDFYKKYTKKEIDLLLNNKKEFCESIKKLIEEDKQKQKRRKNFSIHVNSSRLSVLIAGKEIMRRK